MTNMFILRVYDSFVAALCHYLPERSNGLFNGKIRAAMNLMPKNMNIIIIATDFCKLTLT